MHAGENLLLYSSLGTCTDMRSLVLGSDRSGCGWRGASEAPFKTCAAIKVDTERALKRWLNAKAKGKQTRVSERTGYAPSSQLSPLAVDLAFVDVEASGECPGLSVDILVSATSASTTACGYFIFLGGGPDVGDSWTISLLAEYGSVEGKTDERDKACCRIFASAAHRMDRPTAAKITTAPAMQMPAITAGLDAPEPRMDV